jgi:YHS domain-containing protein
MSSVAESIVLADPVCGKAVGWSSPHRHVHGGALFCFCGEACRARFAAHPSRLAFIALSGGARGTLANPEPEAKEHRAESRDAGKPANEASAPAHSSPATLRDVAPADTVRDDAGNQQSRAGGAFPMLRAWRERRIAARCCRDLLSLYKTVAANHSELRGYSLYQQVVATHHHCDARAAQAVLKEAEQSYASWPANRNLNFRDVVHYLAVSEILAAHSTSPWAEADIKRIIDAAIPHKL